MILEVCCRGFSPIGFRVGLSTIDYLPTSINLVGAPFFNLGTNPDHRTSTQRDLGREISICHKAIDGRFRQASHLFDLRQAKKVAAM